MKTDPKPLSYILITPARNEEAYIEKTILSVISQTILPKKWVIVSDGSTDGTDEIVKKYVTDNSWIELVRMPEHRKHNFAAKAHCFNAGYQIVKDLDFDIIGNLDADISFEKDYFEFLLENISHIPTLGVAGTRYIENDHLPTYSFKDVAGQCQIFRRQCFKDIGEGYTPIKHGGIDNVAVLTARMKGWTTATFSEKTFVHHRPMSTAERSKWTAKIKHGREDYILGNHPIWELSRIIYQITRKPYLIGGMFLFYGYTRALLYRTDRIPQNLINFHRKEQLQRLRLIFKYFLKFKIRIEDT